VVRAALQRGSAEARDQIAGEKWRIAGHGRYPVETRLRKSAMQPCQRAGKTGDCVRDHAVTERCITFKILIGVDQQFVDLRGKTLDDPLHHGLAVQRLQPFVHAAHAPALSAREHDARDRRDVTVG